MVDFLERGGSAYVSKGGVVAYLVVRKSISGNKFVQTIADGRETNNLLELPEC
jgi:hypothetical protein